MTESKKIILFIDEEKILQKLSGIYGELVDTRRLEFDMEILEKPADLSSAKTGSNCPCLFFVQAGENPSSLRRLSEITDLCSSRGHQLVMIGDDRFDYLAVADKYDVGNIIMRDRFDTGMIAAVTRRLLGEHFFGLQPFFPDGYPLYDWSLRISGSVETDDISHSYFSDFGDSLPEQDRPFFYNYASELMTNAIYYGVSGISERQRDANPVGLPPLVDIPEKLAIDVRIVRDEEKYGIGVTDRRGALRRSRILAKIRRQSTIGDEVLPPGIDDNCGRGLYILTRSTRMVFNVLRGVQTEVILMHYFDHAKNLYVPLIINEKYPRPDPQ